MKEMKKTLLISFIAFAYLITGYSQDNAVKLGVGGLAIGNIRTGYERVISDNQSVTVSVGYLIPRKFPAFVELDSELEDIDSKLSGFAISSEYRFYTGKNDAPKGFYLAPYVRYGIYSMKFNQLYENNEVTANSDYINMGIGLQLGYQWVISDVVTVDFYFLGLGGDKNVYSSKITSDDIDVDYAELEEDIRVELEDTPWIGEKVELESGDDYIKAKTSLFLPGIRGGLSIGIAF